MGRAAKGPLSSRGNDPACRNEGVDSLSRSCRGRLRRGKAGFERFQWEWLPTKKGQVKKKLGSERSRAGKLEALYSHTWGRRETKKLPAVKTIEKEKSPKSERDDVWEKKEGGEPLCIQGNTANLSPGE